MDLGYIAKMIGSLVAVSAVLVGFLFLLKRKGFTEMGGLHVETAVNIGPKERIMLVNCGGQQILVGVTSSNIRTLHVMDKALDDSSGAHSKPDALSADDHPSDLDKSAISVSTSENNRAEAK